MKVAYKHCPLRDGCFSASVDGKTAVDYLTPRQLAAILLNACTDPHEP